MRTVILGGSGFIGLNLARRLAAQPGLELVLVDNFSRGRRDEDLERFLAAHPAVRLIEADLSRPGAYDILGGRFDHVYLLASMVGVKLAETRPADVLRTNTAVIMGGLDWMAASGSRRLFFASTSENYAGGYDVGVVPVPTPEDIPLVIKDITNPRFSYAISKIWGEMATCFYASRYAFSAIIGRYHNVYGPRMGYEHVIPELTRKIVEGPLPLPVMSPDQTRAFCHVADAVRATHELMNLDTAGATVVHIGDDRQEITIGDLARRLLALAGRPPDIVPLPAPVGSVSRRLPALDRLRQLIGFEPAVTLDQGLAETFAWYRDHPARKTTA